MKLFRKKSIDPNSGPGWSAYVESPEDFDEVAWQEEIQRQIGEMTSGNKVNISLHIICIKLNIDL